MANQIAGIFTPETAEHCSEFDSLDRFGWNFWTDAIKHALLVLV